MPVLLLSSLGLAFCLLFAYPSVIRENYFTAVLGITHVALFNATILCTYLIISTVSNWNGHPVEVLLLKLLNEKKNSEQ